MKHVCMAAFAIILASACASSVSARLSPMTLAAVAPAASGPKASAPGADKVICKTEKVLGRIAPADVCLTAAEWEEVSILRANSVGEATRVIQAGSNVANPAAEESQVESPPTRNTK